MDDILDVTPPAGIPGALFGAIADKVHARYPVSKRKAQLCAVDVLEVMMKFYEEAAKEEE